MDIKKVNTKNTENTENVENFKDIKNPEIKGNFLWVSTIPHYYTKVTSLTKEDFIEGFHEFKTLLRYAAYLMVYKNYNF